MKKFGKWFSNLKLQRKFFAILLLALLLVFFGTLSISRITNRAYNDALYARTAQLLTLFSQNIQAELDNAVASSFSILADNVLQDALTRLRLEPMGTEEWIEARRTASERLMNISLLCNDITTIRLRSLDGTIFTRSISGAQIPLSLFYEQEKAAKAAHGREIWIPDPEASGALFLVRDVREIADLSLNSIAMLAMRVDMEKIVDRCCKVLSDMGMPLLCAIDLRGTRVYATQDNILDLDMGNRDFVLHNAGEETLFCVRYDMKGSEWTYIAALPYDEIMQSIRWSSGLSTAIAVAALALALGLGSLLTASILKHVKRLLNKYDAFAHDRWKPTPGEDPYQLRQDEIGELHRQFDHMAAEHQRMIEEIYVKQQLLLEAQLRQLRAQIQPHFLYNTLESIYCLAEQGGHAQIATMTAALGRMLRATLKDTRDLIPLSEDMRIAQEYLNIQLIRYGEQLQAEFRIEEEFLSVRIPAMTLQPLVENAVRHGAEEMLETCRIRLYCRREGRYVDLTIEDNGPGMAEDILEKLKSGEIQPEGLGIGLSNIHKRLRLAFRDEECGLRIRREDGTTRVTVRILGEGNEG